MHIVEMHYVDSDPDLCQSGYGRITADSFDHLIMDDVPTLFVGSNKESYESARNAIKRTETWYRQTMTDKETMFKIVRVDESYGY